MNWIKRDKDKIVSCCDNCASIKGKADCPNFPEGLSLSDEIIVKCEDTEYHNCNNKGFPSGFCWGNRDGILFIYEYRALTRPEILSDELRKL